MKFIRITFIIILITITSGCKNAVFETDTFKVIGDVEEVFNIKDKWESYEKVKIDYNGYKIKGVETSTILNDVKIIDKKYDIYIRANDGFMVKMDGETLNDTYIAYTDSFGWEFISEKHPVNSRVKCIKEIIVVKDSDINNYKYGLNIIVNDKTYNYSIGNLQVGEYGIYNNLDGKTTFNYEGCTYTIDVMQQKKIISLSKVYDGKINSFLIMDENGDNRYLYEEIGYIEICDNYVNYIIPDEHKTYSHLKGIVINPPSTSIKDVYIDSLYYLEHNKDVMIIYIDGLSFFQYDYIKNNYKDMYISNIENVEKALTVYKPVTNATFASMITGENPIVHGVLNRHYRELKVQTIFDKAKNMGKESVLIEGDINILNTTLKPILNIDKNNNGFTDDEIYNTALEALNNHYNLMLIHFHSIDDVGHDYGPINEVFINQMTEVDRYIKNLADLFNGKIIIVSDHGMHNFEDKGNHGEFRAEDLLIPYMTFDGGTKDEEEH